MPCNATCVQPSPSQAHCGACHHTFGGVTGFDRHRRDGQCLTPAEIGYADNGSGVYRAPMTEKGLRRIAELRGDGPAALLQTPQTASTTPGVLGIASGGPSDPESEWGDYPLQETHFGSGIYE